MRAHLVIALLSALLTGFLPAGSSLATASTAKTGRVPLPIPAPVPLFANSALEPVGFDDLPGWKQDRQAAAFAAFRKSCDPILARGDSFEPARPIFVALRRVCRHAIRMPASPDDAQARLFFETEFRPFLISGLERSEGFLTGYYEPEVEGSLTPSPDFATPLYRRPADLILEAPPVDGAPGNKGPAYRLVEGERVPYHDRAAIAEGALKERGLELVWIRDPADAFFAHIQGSVRVRLPDGEVLRLNYDGHNGHPYTPVGRLLVERGLVEREKMSMDAIRDYIAAHPEEGVELMHQNRSYVFFRLVPELRSEDGAVGAQGLPLTDGRSLAVDRLIHAYGTPFYLSASLPTGPDGAMEPFERLMIAQDTGSAIIGPARGDIFFGAGDEAGVVAGRVRHPGQFAILLPRSLDPAHRRVPLPVPNPVRLDGKLDGPRESTGSTPMPAAVSDQP